MTISKKGKQLILVGVLCIMSLIGGFFIGRAVIGNQKPKIIVKYEKGETIHDTINKPIPYMVIQPVDTANVILQCVENGIYWELFPTKVVTEYVEITRDDTAAVIKDWGTIRRYNENLFDIDTIGVCNINAEVQYNRLMNISYDYTPIIKTVTITETKIKKFSPFIGLGASVNPWNKQIDPMAGLNVGFFIKEHCGFQFNYNHAFTSKNDFLGLNVLYKF